MEKYNLQTIKKLMVFRDINQRAMAKELGISLTNMRNRLYKRTKIKSSELERIAEALGTTVERLCQE